MSKIRCTNCACCKCENFNNKPLENSKKTQNFDTNCQFCAKTLRKLTDTQLTVDGRDKIIELLRVRIRNCETTYENLLNDFERLRLTYLTVCQQQQNVNLTEINSKLTAPSATVTEAEMSKNHNLTDNVNLTFDELKKCCCQLMDELVEAHTNNETLAETLTVMTSENRQNLTNVTRLSNELSSMTEGRDQELEALRQRNHALEMELQEAVKTVKTCHCQIETLTAQLDNKRVEKCQSAQCRDEKLSMAQQLEELTTVKSELNLKMTELDRMAKELAKFDAKLTENGQIECQLACVKQELNDTCQKLKKELLTNCQLQLEVEGVKREHQRRDSKVATLQTTYDELKRLYDQVCEENDRLRHATCQNDSLVQKNREFEAELTRMSTECQRLKTECALKCLEMSDLTDQHVTDVAEHEKRASVLDDKMVKVHAELATAQAQIELKSREAEQCQEKFDSCQKQLRITRTEYTQLKRDYADMKALLHDQIKKCQNLDDMCQKKSNDPPSPFCPASEKNANLMRKDEEIAELRQKLTSANCDMIELKDDMQKLQCDNTVLKSAISSLVDNLERQIKGSTTSSSNVSASSAESIADDILKSLSQIEQVVKLCGRQGCHSMRCNCLNAIIGSSQYDTTPIQDPSPSCPEDRGKNFNNTSNGLLTEDPLSKFCRCSKKKDAQN